MLDMVRDRLREALRFPGLGRKGGALAATLLGLLWLVSGIYKIQPDEQGVVLRFGHWVDTQEAGIHYHWPFPIETVLLPKTTTVNQLQIGKVDTNDAAGFGSRPANRNQMLTGDENIVEADCTISWQIKDAGQYLFRVLDPDGALKMAAESAMHEVIGRNPIQAALSDKRQQIADGVKDTLQKLLDSYQVGIRVLQVQLQRVDPPYTVIDAFNDVQRARADQERARNEADAYRNDILPRARGVAEHINQEAQAYKTQEVNFAEGEIKNFESLYPAYLQAKDVTVWRLYLESMDELLKKSSKVIIDSSGKNVSSVVPYMPLSELRDRPPSANPAAAPAVAGGTR
ncbi:MAG: FtsH protease activity modulator HflK [Alphaproteobacteria bacterium]|nr:FtsH protease activity modulator HflK [Alphaproteobacteria bacterium]